MCRDEVMMEAEDMCGAPPGSQAFLGSLQDATSKLWKRLSEADQQTFANLAKKWSEEAPPPIVQSRYFISKSFTLVGHDMPTGWPTLYGEKLSATFKPSYLELAECDALFLLHIQMKMGGLWPACESSKSIFQEKFYTLCSEVNKKLQNGADFFKFCPDWQNAQLFTEWQKYAKMCFEDSEGLAFVPQHLCWSHSCSRRC
jgi:hypothetical protein